MNEKRSEFDIARFSRRAFQLRSVVGLVVITAAVLGEGSRIMAEPSKGTGKEAANQETASKANGLEEATFGGGCFWCTEAVFQELKGVKSVVSGYCGGHTKDPTYKEVCTGTTGHAEVIRITFDPKVVTYPELLEVFWKTHDPTTLNQQGADRGTQYRSVIFYHDETQHKLADEYLKKLDGSGAFNKKIVTEITSLKTFYRGEAYHQNYFQDNPGNPYCSNVIKYKVDKFRSVFKDKLKDK